MRTALILVLVLVLASVCVLLWPARRGAHELRAPHTASEPRASETELELTTPEAPSAEAAPQPVDVPPATGSEVREHVAASAAPSVFRAPIRGRLVIAETGAPIEAELRLRLRTIDLTEKESLRSQPDGTFVSAGRYAAGVMLAQVKNDEGVELNDHEAPFDPRATDEWLVPVPDKMYPTLARARVVDRRGGPAPGVRVQLVPAGPDLPYAEGLSDEDGRIELGGLACGSYRLQVHGRWGRNAPRDVALRAGPNDLGPLVLEDPAGAGDLLVRLVMPAEERDSWPQAKLAVRGRRSGLEQLVDLCIGEQKDDGRVVELRLANAPADEYELSLRALDGRSYEPAIQTATPPAVVEFRANGSYRDPPYLCARDARTGAPILVFRAYCRAGDVWDLCSTARYHGESDGRLHLRGYDAWFVWAGGHRWQRGTLPEGDATRIEIQLEPGQSELFRFTDLESDVWGVPDSDSGRRRVPLAGVEVLVDGRSVALSDAEGFACVEAEHLPRSFSYRFAGWRVVRESGSPLHMVDLVRER